MRPDDHTTPPGEPVRIVVGRWAGRRGTVVKRNGSTIQVALHDAHQRVLRDWSGNVYTVPAHFVRPAFVVSPATASVVAMGERDE